MRGGQADRWLARSISLQEIFGVYTETNADLKIMQTPALSAQAMVGVGGG